MWEPSLGSKRVRAVLLLKPAARVEPHPRGLHLLLRVWDMTYLCGAEKGTGCPTQAPCPPHQGGHWSSRPKYSGTWSGSGGVRTSSPPLPAMHLHGNSASQGWQDCE